MDAPLIDVVAAVIVRDGRYLAARRRAELRAGGLWEFPGGKVEPGETAGEALVREIREELGVGIRVTAPLVTVEDAEVGIRLIVLEAELTGAGPSGSTDHDLLAWLSPAELPARDWATPDIPAVEILAARA